MRRGREGVRDRWGREGGRESEAGGGREGREGETGGRGEGRESEAGEGGREEGRGERERERERERGWNDVAATSLPRGLSAAGLFYETHMWTF